MVKGQLPEKIISEVNEYKKILKADKLPISAMYVFGSYAKGTSHKWSDIDVCVVSPQFTDAWDALTYLRRKVPYGVGWIIEPLGFNPVDFSSKYSSLINEIKTYGVEV